MKGGSLMDIVIAIAGALASGFIMRSLGFAGGGGMIYTTVAAILGAAILTAVLWLLKRTQATTARRTPAATPAAVFPRLGTIGVSLVMLAAAPSCVPVSVKAVAGYFPQLLRNKKRMKWKFFMMINGSHPTRKELCYA